MKFINFFKPFIWIMGLKIWYYDDSREFWITNKNLRQELFFC